MRVMVPVTGEASDTSGSDVGSVPITFSIAGVQKAATSTLHSMLVRHPWIAKGAVKERHFFDNEGRTWDSPTYDDYRTVSAGQRARISCDATPIYLFWPHALERMRVYDPATLLIASFRDPIERAFSQWSMERARDATYPDFPDAIAEPRFTSLPHDVPDTLTHGQFRKRTLIARGYYGQQLRRAFDVFDRSQWLLLDFRTFLAEHERTLDRATDFVGVRRFRAYPKLVQKDPTPTTHVGAAPTAGDIRGLADLYGDDLDEFTRLSGIDISHWPTRQVLTGTLDPGDFATKLARKAGLNQ